MASGNMNVGPLGNVGSNYSLGAGRPTSAGKDAGTEFQITDGVSITGGSAPQESPQARAHTPSESVVASEPQAARRPETPTILSMDEVGTIGLGLSNSVDGLSGLNGPGQPFIETMNGRILADARAFPQS